MRTEIINWTSGGNLPCIDGVSSKTYRVLCNFVTCQDGGEKKFTSLVAVEFPLTTCDVIPVVAGMGAVDSKVGKAPCELGA